MAKEFDIYLRKHLVECDLIVYSIQYHDGISVTDRLILEAALNGYVMYKFAAVQMGSALTAHIDDMIKLCLEKLNIDMALGASADFESHSKLYLENSPIIIDTPALKVMERMMSEVENGIVLAVEPLVTQVSSSIGMGDFPIMIGSCVTDTHKHSLLTLRSALVSDAEVTRINQVDHIDVDAPMVADLTLSNLCYQLAFDASAALEIVALVLGTGIRHSLGTWYSSTTINSRLTGTKARKMETVNGILQIMADLASILIKLIYPENCDLIVEANISGSILKRYRLLGEMDDFLLDDFDEMTLGEVDYVILAE